MSGHSKWATIKHKKGAADKARAKLWAKLIRQIEVAARAGGGDIDANPTLRTMVDKAKGASVPNDTIDRAIKRATGELEGVNYESVTYEGYGPDGVAIFVEALTDNRNRTSADVRHLFSKNGGSIAEPGAVAWQFERKGTFAVPRSVAEDDVLLVTADAGAEDLADEGTLWRVTCEPTSFTEVRAALEGASIPYEDADVSWFPKATVSIGDVEVARRILKLVDALDDHDDVQDVHANFDLTEAVLADVSGD
ncbi:MAG: YebC/PmpR family DNA-binding transcriptional regulator [Actinobacteria bacterium]|nr:YebC/PmpR family DNA-binding transcriptional regulator [Actinomycetota bacterium]